MAPPRLTVFGWGADAPKAELELLYGGVGGGRSGKGTAKREAVEEPQQIVDLGPGATITSIGTQYFLLDRYDRNGDAYHLSEAKVAAAGRSDRRMARELAYRGNDEEGPIVVVTLRPGAAVTVFGTQYYPLHFYTRQNGDSQRIDFAKLEQSVKDRGAHQHTQSATEHSGQWDHTAYRASYHPEPDAVASTVTATSTTI
eukprot:m.237542 g.237542  ORF g.237542 m.237542 type:complete len:199 (+) comp26214_c0_seq4:4327-4923(+)